MPKPQTYTSIRQLIDEQMSNGLEMKSREHGHLRAINPRQSTSETWVRLPYVQSSSRCRYVHNVDMSHEQRPLAPDKASARTMQRPVMFAPAAESSPKVVEVAEEV